LCGVASASGTRIAVLASGNGSNFEALALAARDGALGGEIVVLLTDNPVAPALERARRLGIDALTMPVGRFRTRIEDERPWLEALRERRVDVVLCAGFMRRLHATLIEPFEGRMLNVHPSLLPAFPGLDAIGQAFRQGVPVTGCTVHLVEDALDAGPIVAQEPVGVEPGDTIESLTARIHEAEHRLYPASVRRFLTEPWTIDGPRVVFGSPRPEVSRG
jgi:phosphoribosylglycinamide formyltransferase-1